MAKEFHMRASNARFDICGDRIELFAFQSGDGGHNVAEPLSLKQHGRYEHSNPFVTLDKSEAQILMDDLWQTGLRPSEGTGSAGSLKATQEHLKDLRTVLFHKLGIK